MTKSEFLKEARECGYSEEEITEMLAIIEDAQNDGVPMKYEDIVLIEQPKY